MRPGDPRITLLTEVSGLRKLERVYNEVGDRHGDDFVRVLLEQLGVHLEVDPDDLARVPKEGGVAFVANHPYGAVDGLALLHVLSGVRPDLKVMANFLLQQLEPLADSFIGVNPFEQLKARSSFQGMRAALQHRREPALGSRPQQHAGLPDVAPLPERVSRPGRSTLPRRDDRLSGLRTAARGRRSEWAGAGRPGGRPGAGRGDARVDPSRHAGDHALAHVCRLPPPAGRLRRELRRRRAQSPAAARASSSVSSAWASARRSCAFSVNGALRALRRHSSACSTLNRRSLAGSR